MSTEMKIVISADDKASAVINSIGSGFDGFKAKIASAFDSLKTNFTNLHFIVADLLQGVALMRGEDMARSRHDGAALVHGALKAYGQYFDDAAWKPNAPMQEK